MNKIRVSQIISGVLSFMMMICITVLAIFICLSLTLFHSGYITRRMNDKYFESALKSLSETLKDEIAPPSHMPEEVFDDLFNINQIKEDSQESVQAVLADIDYTYDSSRVRRHVMDKFAKYADENNIDIAETNLETLADFCVEEYERQISVPYLKSFSPVRRLFQNVFTYVLLIFSFVLIMLALFLFRIHRFKHRALRYCACSLFASAIMMVPVPLFFLMQGLYHKINISPEHVRMLYVSMISATLSALVISGILIAAAGFALIPLIRKMRNKAIRGERDY